jgi:hypothetical protein
MWHAALDARLWRRAIEGTHKRASKPPRPVRHQLAAGSRRVVSSNLAPSRPRERRQMPAKRKARKRLTSTRRIEKPTLSSTGNWAAHPGNDDQGLKEFPQWPTCGGITGDNDGSQRQASLVRRGRRDRGVDRDCVCGRLVWRHTTTSAAIVRAIGARQMRLPRGRATQGKCCQRGPRSHLPLCRVPFPMASSSIEAGIVAALS